jgi:hypothetical protein
MHYSKLPRVLQSCHLVLTIASSSEGREICLPSYSWADSENSYCDSETLPH